MPSTELIEEALTGSIIGAFFDVYNTLGFGFLESVYVAAMVIELRNRGHHVEREVPVRVRYKGQLLGIQRVDLIVDRKVILEVKSTWSLHKDAARQVYSYVRATDLEVGLLLYFGREPEFYRVVSIN